MFSFLGVLLSLIASIILYFAYKFLIGPYLLLRHYKKQGGITFFHKTLVGDNENYKNAVEKNDYFHIYREALKANPNASFIAENFGDKVLLLPASVEMTKKIISKLDVYHKSLEIMRLMADLGSGTLSTAEDDAWKQRRKMVTSVLNFDFVKELIPMIRQVSQDQFNNWVQKKELENINLILSMGLITGEVSGRFFFGQMINEHTIRGLPVTTACQKAFDACAREQVSFFSNVFGSDLVKKNILPRHKELNNLTHDIRAKVKEMIKESMEKGIKEANLLKLILDYYGAASQEDEVLEQIVGEFIGLFTASTETTAFTMSVMLYYLSKNPRCWEKFKEELEREITDVNSITIDDLNRMEYTTACLKEAVRLGIGLGGFFFREAIKDDDLCGVHIKKGTIIFILMDMIHTNENYYSSPHEFIPERWLGDARFAKDGCRTEPFSFLGFSAGPRNCPGQHLAIMVSKIILAVFVKTFNYKIPETYDIKYLSLGMVEPVLATLEPKK